MCGLYGAVSTALAKEEVDNVIDLGTITMLRGRHSSGLISVSRHKAAPKIEWVKDRTNSANLLGSKEAEDLLKKHPYILAGHCRHATVGAINTANAHPFHVGNIIGMHNGTLTFRDTKVPAGMTDSEHLFTLINERGLEDALKDTFGAYALIWVDTQKGTLNMIRNEQRTLYIMHGGGTTYWSSEYSFLGLIKHRGNNNNFSTPEAVKPHTLIQTSLTDVRRVNISEVNPDKAVFSMKDHVVEDKKETRPFKAPVTSTAVPVTKKETLTLAPAANQNTGTVMGPVKPRPVVPDKTTPIFKMYKGYRALPMEWSKAREILEKGCAGCDRVARMLSKVYFYNKESFICETCANIPARVEYVGANPNDLWLAECTYARVKEGTDAVQS